VPAQGTDPVLCVVEIPKGSRNKYEYDPELGGVKLDRFISASVVYPTDYGYVPELGVGYVVLVNSTRSLRPLLEMRKLLYLLTENFTHIIIDSPPAISFTDASILSTMVDGVMLVVHGGRSSRAVVRRAKQQLQDVGAHIFGIVLNNVKLEGTDYYYYSGYYSGYYSDDDTAPEGAGVAGAGDRPGAV